MSDRVAAEEAANETACRECAIKNGHSVEQADQCSDGDLNCTGCPFSLISMLDRHIRQMAPHQQKREAGRLLALARNELSASQAREAELREKLEGLTGEAAVLVSKLKAAEAIIKASQEQEPVGEVLEFIGDEKFIVRINRPTNVGELLWPAASIPPELTELQRENAELRGRTDSLEVVALRKENAELRKSLRIEELFRLNKMTKPATGHDYWKNWYEAKLTAETAELRKLLESKVPEEALIEIVTQAHMAGQFNQSQRDPSYYEARVYYGEKQLSIRAMLAAAPQPKEPKQSPETDLDEALRRQ